MTTDERIKEFRNLPCCTAMEMHEIALSLLHALKAERDEAEAAVEYERNLHRKTRSELDSCLRAWHNLINQGEDFYSWQRDWQDGARLILGLGEGASVEDINLALLLREKK